MKSMYHGRLLPLILIGFAGTTQAQTIICGTASGTWTPAGNPYDVVCNSSVPDGTTLTIQPGCNVVLGPGVHLTASNSLIQAVGTANQRISFQFSDTTNSYLYVINPSGNPVGTNRFKYCDFTYGSTAVVALQYGQAKVSYVEVMNCTFTGCGFQGIFAQGVGVYFNGYGELNPVIENCIFDHTGSGCNLYIGGNSGYYGYAYPVVKGNIFRNLTNQNSAAICLTNVYSYAGPSSEVVVNNTFVNCRVAINCQDPWTNGVIRNNIFVGSTNALMTTSAILSGTVSYNDFYGNATNFTGYPASYGNVATVNRNGTSCDLSYNIFQNPIFASNDFRLATNSACVDAGEGSAANDDICFPPSLGTVINDIGAYGGPPACGWVQPVPLLFPVSIAQYVGISFIPPTNGSYRLESASLSNTNIWTPLTNVNLTTPFTYYDAVGFGSRFYRAVFLP